MRTVTTDQDRPVAQTGDRRVQADPAVLHQLEESSGLVCSDEACFVPTNEFEMYISMAG